MPLISVKLIEGVFSSDQKQQIIERLTDAMVSIEGENMRQVTWCVIEEVKSGDWGIAGNAITAQHVRALDVTASGTQMRFRAVRGGEDRTSGAEIVVTLNLPGAHNVRNALAAIAIGLELGVPEAKIAKALAEFRGVGRRFQQYGKVRIQGGGSFTLVDDYGHHPAEMAATLAAARGAFPKRRILLAFQPHRYTRTRDCFEDFVAVLSTADALVLTEVYPAGEAPIVAADGRALARAVRVQGKVEPVFVEKVADLPVAILAAARDGDVVLTMGAGSIGNVAGQLASRLRSVNGAA